MIVNVIECNIKMCYNGKVRDHKGSIFADFENFTGR